MVLDLGVERDRDRDRPAGVRVDRRAHEGEVIFVVTKMTFVMSIFEVLR